MDKRKRKEKSRWRRKQRVRNKIFGAPDRPRLSVYRTNKHIYAQVIDDLRGETLVQSSSLNKELKDELNGKSLKEKSRGVGIAIAEKCKEKGIDRVVFDKGRFKYHGCIKNLADGAREGGLQF